MFSYFRTRLANTDASSEPARKVAASERVYAIGDIHGRFDLLQAMLDKISADLARFSDARKPRIVFLGDYVDRGDQSQKVIELLSDTARLRDRLKIGSQVRFDFLAGNHEIAMLAFLDDPTQFSDWLRWGGLQTVASFGLKTKLLSDEAYLVALRNDLSEQLSPCMGFLTQLERLVVSGDFVFVHAALEPDVALDVQPGEAVFWGQTAIEELQEYPTHKIVHGHFAHDHPVSLPHRICVDTGAYYSGCLTAVRLDDTEDFLTVRL